MNKNYFLLFILITFISLCYLGGSSKPELSPFPDLKLLQQERLEPVVDAGMVQLRHPGAVMEVAEDLGILLGDLLPARDQEASAA